MDRENRSELVKTIEAQNEKIHKYENKLRDLIQAYRGLAKEKEALEASVQALSAAHLQGSKDAAAKEQKKKETTEKDKSEPREGSNDEQDESGDDQVKASQSEEPEGERGETEEEDACREELAGLRSQLATLSASLATVMQEKSKMEANYISEKKTLRQELEEQETRHEEETRKANKGIHDLTEEVKECRIKIRVEQNEREKEHTDQSIMLKELQKLLAQERMAKEQTEHQMDDLKQALVEQQNSTEIRAEYESRFSEYQQEMDGLKSKLRASEAKASEPSPLLLKLQKEVVDMKAQHSSVLQLEQQRVTEAKTQLAVMAAANEERIAKLEGKLSEISEVAGNYERLRYQDQASILKLRERVSQLDQENTALANKACGVDSMEGNSSVSDEQLGVEEIVDRMVKLKASLITANEQAEKPVNVSELMEQLGSEQDWESLHSKCKQKFDSLKEEFERYKLRAQSVLKSKSTKDSAASVEVEGFRTQVSELKERLRQLRGSEEELLSQMRSKEEHFSKSLISIGDKHKTEIQAQETVHKQRLGELEAEIRRHRDRTIALLAEKDREMDRLRSTSAVDKLNPEYMDSLGGTYRQMSPPAMVPDQHLSEAGAASSEEGRLAITELLSRSSLLSAGGLSNDSALLHFSQEQARKDVDINTLRRQKHSLEVALRELQQTSLLKAEQLTDNIDDLKEEIRKLERNKSRESANLEYLKNVVYHYMVTYDVVAKKQMLNAISTILEFSPKERQAVQHLLNSGWWVYSHKPNTIH